MNFLISILLLSASVQAQMEAPVFGGTGCVGSKSLSKVVDAKDMYQIGLQVAIAKMNSPALTRNTCTFRMPIKLKSNEKVILSNVHHHVKLSAGKTAKAKSQLEFFIAGQKMTPLIAEVQGVNTTNRITRTLQSSERSESECGKDVIIAGNLSGLVQGGGRGTVATQPVYFGLEIVNCN